MCVKAPNEYAIEYFEMHRVSIQKGQRVLIIDDLIATGSSTVSAIDIVKEIGDYLKELAGEAMIRSGDYPRERSALNVTLILSKLSDMEKVRHYYYRLTESAPTMKKRHRDAEIKLKEISEAAKDIPSLL